MSFFSIGDKPSAPRSDEAILQAAILRPWEFSELVDRYEAAFLRKANNILYDSRDAEEVVQDTFTKIYVNASTFTPHEGATFSSWAYRILVNTAYTRYKQKRTLADCIEALDPAFEALVADVSTGQQRETADMVERLLAELPEHISIVLRLHYLERWPQQDIADHLGEAVGTIKVRIHRSKAVLRKLLTDKHL